MLRACTSWAASNGTPGLTTIRSCPRKVRSPWPPVSTVIPCSNRSRISSRSSASGLVSDTVTRAPRDFRNSAEATPDLPRPTTSTRLPVSSTFLSVQHLPNAIEYIDAKTKSPKEDPQHTQNNWLRQGECCRDGIPDGSDRLPNSQHDSLPSSGSLSLMGIFI